MLFQPRNEDDLNRLTDMADYLTDCIGGNEHHPLIGLLEIVGTLISEYERQHIREPEGTPVGCMKYLMEEHGLTPSDLHEIGTPDMVSEILEGRRDLSKSDIRVLSRRFGCNPAVFL
jgi:HTH-type transcriptional regulator/antitoxin HigA